MRLGRIRRYNPKKPGSHEIAVWCCDWDLALLIKAVRTRLDRAQDDGLKPGTVKRYKALEGLLRRALSKVLKVELADIRRQKKQIAEIEQFLRVHDQKTSDSHTIGREPEDHIGSPAFDQNTVEAHITGRMSSTTYASDIRPTHGREELGSVMGRVHEHLLGQGHDRSCKR